MSQRNYFTDTPFAGARAAESEIELHVRVTKGSLEYAPHSVVRRRNVMSQYANDLFTFRRSLPLLSETRHQAAPLCKAWRLSRSSPASLGNLWGKANTTFLRPKLRGHGHRERASSLQLCSVPAVPSITLLIIYTAVLGLVGSGGSAASW